MKASCDNCQYFQHNTIHTPSNAAPYNGGECRYRPPVVIQDQAVIKTLWPDVRGHHWCGAFSMSDTAYENARSKKQKALNP